MGELSGGSEERQINPLLYQINKEKEEAKKRKTSNPKTRSRRVTPEERQAHEERLRQMRERMRY